MLHSSRQATKGVLYVAGQTFGFEQLIQHCLWKLLSETGLIHVDQLTEMESKVLADLLAKKAGLSSELHPDLGVLNRAVDKIVCHVKNLQVQGQKYNAVIAENHNLKVGMRNLMRMPEEIPGNAVSHTLERSIDEVGLSKRTVRLLRSYGIDTLEALRACPLSRLRNQTRVGVKTIHEIETILSSYFSHASAER